MKQAKKNLLGTATPIMRQVTLIILREGASSITAAGIVLRESRREVNPGPFTFKRDLPVAFALAEEIRRRRRMRRERNDGLGLMVWYGYGRIHTQRQTPAQEKLKDERARFAKRLERHIVRRVSDLRNPLVLAAAKRVMKHGASGGCTFNIHCLPTAWYGVTVTKDWRRVNKGRDQWASLCDEHNITITPRWLGLHRLIGAGDGTVEGRFLLDARLFHESEDRRIWEARTARTGRGYQAIVENVWLSCYGKAVTVHPTLNSAVAAKPPALQVEIERPLPGEDDLALSALAVA